MRIINADALFREMEKAQWYNNADRDEIAEELVLNAPTIEERKKGHWIDTGTHLKCSVCTEYLGASVRGCNGELYITAFCPNCGARMEK